MEKIHIHTLILKYIENRCTQDEIDFILSWCNESEENKKEFIRIKKAWLVSDKKNDEKITSLTPDVWKNIINNISEKASKTYTKRTLIYYASISAAAAIILMICINLFTNKNIWNESPEYTTFYMSPGEKGQVFLPDGTKVWLNSDSKLTLKNDFNIKNRTVVLEGEAYFDVVKSDKHNFVVQTSSVDVKVYGTAFNVTAYPQADDVEVSLQRGAVSLYRKGVDEKLASLVPNQHISINRKTYLTKIDSFEDDSSIAWTFDELIFDYSPLDEVFSKMRNWYGVNITIVSPPVRQDLKYRFKIKSESLTEILQLIDKITPIEYKIDGKEVYIKYK